MKTQIKNYKNIQFVISIIVIFTLFTTSTIAQPTREQKINRIVEIDDEINRLGHLREGIGLGFEKYSRFSKGVRPILTEYNRYVEAISSNQEELSKHFSRIRSTEQIEAELKSLIAKREALDAQFKNYGGVLSPRKVQCNTIEDLQKEYTLTSIDYHDKKKEYDEISKELGLLQNEKLILTDELKYMTGSSEGEVYELEGCWALTRKGKTSIITVEKKVDRITYVGFLTVNELHNYDDGQKMFKVSRTSNDTFKGTEYTWEEKSNGKKQEVKLSAILTINIDGTILTWKSDETVTMIRCK